MDVELLDVSEDVHVEPHRTNKTEKKVNHGGDAHGVELGQDDVGGGEGHGEPGGCNEGNDDKVCY